MKLLKKLHKEMDGMTEKVFNEHFNTNNPEKEFKQHDSAIIGLLEDMVGKIDSLIFLVENNKSNGIDALTRMIMENYVFLKFILKEDTVNRGTSYFYSLELRQLKMYKTLTEESMEGSELRKFLNIKINNLKKEFHLYENEIHVKEIKEKYVSSLNHKNYLQKWYNFNGKIRNFKALCYAMGYEKEYAIIYQSFSGEIHALDTRNYMEFKLGNEINIFRKEIDTNAHINIVSNFAIDIVREVYNYYELYKEVKRFNTLLGVNLRFV